ncbi:hypothetical protein WMW72_21425 [Paenibacillus filicis]|uniref:Uncharacterized protein n=1 Tax=Paenibacillus filicis TaxID=669464 RepID=A0ABU9DQW2_9BACL
MSDYLAEIQRMSVPFMKPYTYGHLETAGHKNKNREVMFYDKQKQCRDTKEGHEIIEQAEGLLRMEIRPSHKELRKFSPKRRAIELLTRSFFTNMTGSVLKHVQFTAPVEGVTLGWLKSQPYSIHQIESTMGFNLLKKTLTASEIKQLYKPSTYDNRRTLARKIHFQALNL